MSLRMYIFTMCLATLMCWAAWIFVLLNVDPGDTSFVGHGFFYSSLLLALIGTATLGFFSLYRFLFRDKIPAFRFVQKSFREAIVVALFAVLALYLLAHGLLTPWNGLCLGTLFVLVVSFLFSVQPVRVHHHIPQSPLQNTENIHQ